MFIGHYGVALALKGTEPRGSLGLLFLGVQLVDIVFFPLVVLGIERMNIVPNYTASTHFELAFMPYTHSLVATFAWGIAAFVVAYALQRPQRVSMAVPTVVAAAVMSHWFLDLIVHVPDLPLLGDDSTKLGFGLWNSAPATFALEAVILALGLWIYLRATRPLGRSLVGRFGMPAFALFLVLLNIQNLFGAPPAGFRVVFVLSMGTSLGFAAIAFWLDRKRAVA